MTVNKQFLKNLMNALPKAQWDAPQLGASYVIDKNGEILGHFDYEAPNDTFFLNKDYSHFKAVKQRLTDYGITTKPKQYLTKEVETNE